MSNQVPIFPSFASSCLARFLSSFIAATHFLSFRIVLRVPSRRLTGSGYCTRCTVLYSFSLLG